MKAFNGYDAAKEAAKFVGGERLPIGAYVCQIKNVQYVNGEAGYSDRIDILFDITEGEQKDFFRNQFNANSNEDKKWKGRKSIYVPSDDGSEQDTWTKNTFAKWVNGIEDSNPGYKWDWDESKWKGKYVGIVFGETGTVIEGREVVYTEPRFACSIEKVRNGSAPKAKFSSKNGYTGNSNASTPAANSTDNGWMVIAPSAEEEIPFN